MEKIVYSIIIPTYNRADFLSRAVNSIIIQETPLELIIVDDGSEDNTQEIVQTFKDKRIKYIQTKNRERGAARNLGLRIAHGEYINYFDSDDIFMPCLKDLYEYIEKHLFPPVAFGSIEDASLKGKIRGAKKGHKNFRSSIVANNFLACGSVFLRRDIALQFPFSEDRRLSGTEDWELWLRVYTHYDFIDCSIIIFKQVDHSHRSLKEKDIKKITARESLFANMIQRQNSLLLKRFSQSEINLLIADRYTLIALAQSEDGHLVEAFGYWRKSIQQSFRVVTRKRFWAVGKKLIHFHF